MSRDSSSDDVIVVGGGIIGLSIAYELLRLGRQVRVLERERPGSGATRAAGGMLAPVSEAEIEEAELLALGQESLRRYPEFVAAVERDAAIDCGYRSDGTLWIATNRDELAELDRLAELLARKELCAERLDAQRIRIREPHLSGRVLAGLLVEQDHQVDPRALTHGLERAILARGGRIVCGATVSTIHSGPGPTRAVEGHGIDGRGFELVAHDIVLAAGAWCGVEIGLAVDDPGLRPVKGQLLRLHGADLLRHVVRTPEVYLIPRSNGDLLVGATVEEVGFDDAATAGPVMDLLRHAWEALPGIYDLEFRGVEVGFRSATEDQLPLIGPAIEDPQLFLAAGHYRNGVLLAPATAHHAARWIATGRAPRELEPFRPRHRPARAASARPMSGPQGATE